MYGSERADAYQCDKADLHTLIEYEQHLTVKQMEEYMEDPKQYPVTDQHIVTFLLRPSTKTDEDRDAESVHLQKNSKPTAVQVAANSLKQKQETENDKPK